jgi:branched-subunit amino acid aminotransferase/4-amino-4-deoxychorismate lyase
MAQQYPEWIWQNGEIKPWKDATTHVMSHALHYGSSVFEGIRSYATPDGAAIFRLTDHLHRLYQSARIYDMVLPHTPDELAAACRDVIKKNELGAAYLRPVAYRGLGGFGTGRNRIGRKALPARHAGVDAVFKRLGAQIRAHRPSGNGHVDRRFGRQAKAAQAAIGDRS